MIDRTPLLRAEPCPARRHAARPPGQPSEIPLNTGEGLRAAYYVPDDATSYSSFKEHVHQIDMLFPQWLHVSAPDGTLLAMSSDNTIRSYPVIDGNTVHDPDDLNKIKNVIQATKEDTEIFPHLNNYNAHSRNLGSGHRASCWPTTTKRALLRQQLSRFFTALPAYRGLSLDFENLDDSSDAGLHGIHPASSTATCTPAICACIVNVAGGHRGRST